MPIATINRFDAGMGESKFDRTPGGFAFAKHFDTLTYPYRLVPQRTSDVDTTDQSKIGNLIVGTDGLIYGLGTDVANPTFQQIYKKSAPSTPGWTALANSKSGYVIPDYTLFVEYKNYFYTARSGYIVRCDRADVVGVNASWQALSWTNIAQGIVHPADDILYIPYDNKIMSLNGHAGSPTVAALTLPDTLKITSIAPYGNYLAIATVPVNGTTSIKSNVFLWGRDTSLATVSDVIDWGTGNLSLLQNLEGVLVGISDTGGASSLIQDRDSIKIKVWSGGTPQLVKEISTVKETTTAPDAVINPRVNFVFRGKMYFSANITGGSTSPNYVGLWSLGKSKLTSLYSVTVERMATSGGTETGVLACAMLGDFASMVHTAVGTVTITNNNATKTTAFAATSIYESLVNPGMEAADYDRKKQLGVVAVRTVPLNAGATVVVKYRVDAQPGASWTTILTQSATGSTGFECSKDSSGSEFTSGKNYEFRIESTGGAEITGLAYKYEKLATLI